MTATASTAKVSKVGAITKYSIMPQMLKKTAMKNHSKNQSEARKFEVNPRRGHSSYEKGRRQGVKATTVQ